MSVAILRQGDYLIASIQSDLSDRQVLSSAKSLRKWWAGAALEGS